MTSSFSFLAVALVLTTTLTACSSNGPAVEGAGGAGGGTGTDGVGGAGGSAQATGGGGAGPIAPTCSESLCADVDARASLDCYDEVSEEAFTAELAVVGVTTSVTCAIADEEGRRHLDLSFRDDDAPEGDLSEVGLRLRDYAGPGTYSLHNTADDLANVGLYLNANSSRTEPRTHETVGTVTCIEPVCEAIVAPETDPLPDSDSVEEWRIRVEVVCPAGGEVGDMACEPPGAQTSCTFVAAPTFRFDVACRH